jgi:hypothetical protein
MAEDRSQTRAVDSPTAGEAPPPPSSPPVGSSRAPLAANAQPSGAPAGAFSPPAARRTRGAASRQPLGTAIVFGVIFADAVALIVYFAAR